MNTSGYITIDINGQAVGLKFGLLAIKQIGEYEGKVPFFQKYTDKDGKEGETYSILGIAHIAYAGYVNNQYMKMKDTELTFEDVYEWIENEAIADRLSETVLPLVECYNNSKFMKPAVGKDEPDTKKKSGPGKK